MSDLLFDDWLPSPRSAESLARSGNPSTSRAAAHEILSKLGDRQRFALQCVRENPGKTQQELDALFPDPHDPRRIGRRLNELADVGLVRVGEKRRCRRSGKICNTYYAVEE